MLIKIIYFLFGLSLGIVIGVNLVKGVLKKADSVTGHRLYHILNVALEIYKLLICHRLTKETMTYVLKDLKAGELDYFFNNDDAIDFINKELKQQRRKNYIDD